MRSSVIRLKKSLQRLAAACPERPSWLTTMEVLEIPEKGQPLSPLEIEGWLLIVKYATQDWIRFNLSDVLIREVKINLHEINTGSKRPRAGR
jgi:hypothetical protein